MKYFFFHELCILTFETLDNLWPMPGWAQMINMPPGGEQMMECFKEAACVGGPPTPLWGYCEKYYKGILYFLKLFVLLQSVFEEGLSK